MARILPHKFEHDRFLSTRELLEFLAKSQKSDEILQIECNITSGCLNCTHYIAYTDDKIFDIGIDDQELEYTHDEFIAQYSQTTWRIADTTLKSLGIPL